MSVLKFFRNAFAVSGTRTTVGDTTDDSVNYYDGYTSNYELDPESDPDGLYIDRGSMNQLFYDLTSNVQHYQQHLFPEWIEDSDGVGTPYSYDAGAIVAYYDTEGGTWGYYLSTADGNTGTPGTGPNWVEFSFGTVAGYSAITSNADAWGGVATVSEVGETVVGNTISFTEASAAGFSVSLVYDYSDDALYWNGDKLLTEADYGLSSSAAWGFIPFVAATGETYVGDSIEFTASSESGASFRLAYSSTDDGLYWNGDKLVTAAGATYTSGSLVTLFSDDTGYFYDGEPPEKTHVLWVSQGSGTISYSFEMYTDQSGRDAQVDIYVNGTLYASRTEDSITAVTKTGTIAGLSFGDVVSFSAGDDGGLENGCYISNVLLSCSYTL
jgi:hypothetical protein